jgi:hypothetical protein
MPSISAKSVIQQLAADAESRAPPSSPGSTERRAAAHTGGDSGAPAHTAGPLSAHDDASSASQLEAGVRAAAAVSDAIAARVKQVLASLDFPEARPAELPHDAVSGLFAGGGVCGQSGRLPREETPCAGAPPRGGSASAPSCMTAAQVASAVREQGEVLTVALAARHARNAAVVRAHLRECADAAGANAVATDSADAAPQGEPAAAVATTTVAVEGCEREDNVDSVCGEGTPCSRNGSVGEVPRDALGTLPAQSSNADDFATAAELAAAAAHEGVQTAACGGRAALTPSSAASSSDAHAVRAQADAASTAAVSTAEDSTAAASTAANLSAEVIALRELEDAAAVRDAEEATLRELDAVALAAEEMENAAVASEQAASAAAAAASRKHEDQRLAAFRASDAAVDAAISSVSRYAVLASAYARAASVATHTFQYAPSPPPVRVEGGEDVAPVRVESPHSLPREMEEAREVETGLEGAASAGMAGADVDMETERNRAMRCADDMLAEVIPGSSASPPLDDAEGFVLSVFESGSSIFDAGVVSDTRAGDQRVDTEADAASNADCDGDGSDANESAELVDLLNAFLTVGGGPPASSPQKSASASFPHAQTEGWGVELADAVDVVDTLAATSRRGRTNKSDLGGRSVNNPGGSPAACK